MASPLRERDSLETTRVGVECIAALNNRGVSSEDLHISCSEIFVSVNAQDE